MDITAVNRDSVLTAAATPPVAVENAAEHREIVRAVKAINAAELLGGQNELVFQLDHRTRKVLVQVVNRDTKEVVTQYPPEYVLRLAEGLKR